MQLNKLDFGAPAAERDVGHGLKKYFVESESYKNFKEGKKTILLGNRGTGKSAIFKMLAEHSKIRGDLVIELTPENYSYEILSQIMSREAEGSWAKQGAYAAGWKYLIYVLAMKKILEKSPSLKKNEAKEIYRYLRDHHAGVQRNPLDILISYIKRLDDVKLKLLRASMKVRELQYLYKLEEISHLIPILETVCRSQRVVVFIDELDTGWDASEDAKAFIAGLFQAAVSINETMENFRIMISLRQELYDSIPSLYEDAQKVWDLIEVIKWDRNSLMSLVAKRIEHSFPDLTSKTPTMCWRSVFSRPVANGVTSSFDYMLERTLYRPREIIQFCTQAKERAMYTGSTKINLGNIREIETYYSEHRTKDIAAEYRFQFPGLIKVFEAFRGKNPQFEVGALEDFCIRLILRDISTGLETAWLEDQEPDYLISTLWHVGFLRAQTAGSLGGNGGAKSFVGPHQVSTLNVRGIQKFDVHPMFQAYLGINNLNAGG